MGTEQIVKRVENLRRAQFLRAVDGGGKILPEVPQHLLPVDLRIGNAVKLFFEPCREIIFDVAREEAFEECNDKTALVFRTRRFLSMRT